MKPAAIARAAEILSDGRLRSVPLGALPEECRPRDEAEAYAIQEALHERLAAQGYGPVAGYKIGCTTPVMQAYIGIGQPLSGAILAGTVQRETGRFRHADFVRLGVECEIAVRLGAALSPDQAPFTREDVAAAVGECMAAIEVVDDRYDDYLSLGAPTLLADDFFNAGCVLGKPPADWRRLDLTTVTGSMLINGVEAGRGTGADVMGHPFEAVSWLANTMARHGRGLSADDFVLTGSIVETRWLAAGDEVVVDIGGLGEAHARFD